MHIFKLLLLAAVSSAELRGVTSTVYFIGPSRNDFIRADVVRSFFAAMAVAVGEGVQADQVKLVDVKVSGLQVQPA
jgi:hypothetical protein